MLNPNRPEANPELHFPLRMGLLEHEGVPYPERIHAPDPYEEPAALPPPLDLERNPVYNLERAFYNYNYGGGHILPITPTKQESLNEIIRIVTQNPDILNQNITNGNTALHLAAYSIPEETVQYLINKGADIDAKNERGKKPIHLAAGYGSLENFKTLIGNGADPEAQSDDGKTPLHYAVITGNLPIVHYLVNYCGADINAMDNAGHTPLYYAETTRDMIREAGQARVQFEERMRFFSPDAVAATRNYYERANAACDIIVTLVYNIPAPAP